MVEERTRCSWKCTHVRGPGLRVNIREQTWRAGVGAAVWVLPGLLVGRTGDGRYPNPSHRPTVT